MTARLVVLDALYGDIAVESAAAAPYGVTVEDASSAPYGAAVEDAATADGVLVQYGAITADAISRSPGWRLIGRYGVGVDNIDVDAATRGGIAVINVPDYCVEEVATHTAALVLAATRKLTRSRPLIETGRWNDWQELAPIRPLSERTLGLVGTGRIGREVIRLLAPFFARVVAFDPVAQPPAGVDRVELDELFATADVVSLHCPLTPETRHLVDAARLSAMKREALLVNVSRGGLIDTEALAQALAAGVIAGAALDVLPTEPPDLGDPLLAAPNLLLTNHVAWYSEAALRRLRLLLAQRCCTYLQGGPVPTVVNARELAAAAAR